MSASTLETRLRRLRLGYMATHVEAQNTDSIASKHSSLEFADALAKRIRAAQFPVTKTLEDFDFDFQPKLDVKLIKSLASCDFVERRENALLVGQPGTGKTHLAISLGLKAIERGYRVRFTTISKPCSS